MFVDVVVVVVVAVVAVVFVVAVIVSSAHASYDCATLFVFPPPLCLVHLI